MTDQIVQIIPTTRRLDAWYVFDTRDSVYSEPVVALGLTDEGTVVPLTLDELVDEREIRPADTGYGSSIYLGIVEGGSDPDPIMVSEGVRRYLELRRIRQEHEAATVRCPVP